MIGFISSSLQSEEFGFANTTPVERTKLANNTTNFFIINLFNSEVKIRVFAQLFNISVQEVRSLIYFSVNLRINCRGE